MEFIIEIIVPAVVGVLVLYVQRHLANILRAH